MDLSSHYQTSKFVVKNAREFKKLFETLVEGDKNLIAEKDGLTITGANLVYNDPEEESELDSIAELISKNLREGHTATLTILHIGSALDAEYYYMNEFGVSNTYGSPILAELKKKHFPIKVKCRQSVRHEQNKVWIEKDEIYLATARVMDGKREMYVICYENGNEVTWGKEYFDGTNANA